MTTPPLLPGTTPPAVSRQPSVEYVYVTNQPSFMWMVMAVAIGVVVGVIIGVLGLAVLGLGLAA